MRRIGIVGICQVHGVGHALAAMLDDVEVMTYEAPIVCSGGRLQDAVEYLRSCDIVFSQSVGPEYGELGFNMLRERVRRIRLLPVVVFDGFHPDIVYIAQNDLLLASPVGAYHSGITAGAFSLGLNERDTEELFNTYVFSALGYLDRFAISREAFLITMLEAGYDVSVDVDDWTIAGPFMHTINHPRPIVLASLARHAAVHEELLSPAHRLPTWMPDHLGNDTVWPVYPEIAAKLPFEGDYVFKRSYRQILPNGNSPCIGLRRFIAESFALYSGYPGDAFKTEQVLVVKEKLKAILH
jgi:hypothetical protein